MAHPADGGLERNTAAGRRACAAAPADLELGHVPRPHRRLQLRRQVAQLALRLQQLHEELGIDCRAVGVHGWEGAGAWRQEEGSGP